jgi:hypothetical protein
VYAEGGKPAPVANGGGGMHVGGAPTTPLSASLILSSPAAGGGGQGARGDTANTDRTTGGAHIAYNGTTESTPYAMGGDGGDGGLTFLAPDVLAHGGGANGYPPGGGGGGGCGGGAGVVSPNGTWTFPPGHGGGGARGFLRVIAY